MCSNVFWPLFRIWRVCWLFNEASDTAGNYAAGFMLGSRILCLLGAGYSTSIWLWQGSNKLILADFCTPANQTFNRTQAWRWPDVVDLPALFVHLCRIANPTCLVAKGALPSVWCAKRSKTEEVMEQTYQHSCIQAACSPPSSPPPPNTFSTFTPIGQDLNQREVRVIEDNFVSHRVDRDMMWQCGGNGGLGECLKKTEGM